MILPPYNLNPYIKYDSDTGEIIHTEDMPEELLEEFEKFKKDSEELERKLPFEDL